MSTVIRILASVALLALAACTTAPKKDLALEQVRTQLDELKANEDLAGYAPLALGEAERALRQAETATGNDTYRIHLIYMADRRIQIARAIAQREQLEQELDRLGDERSAMLVRASQLEAPASRLVNLWCRVFVYLNHVVQEANRQLDRLAETLPIDLLSKRIGRQGAVEGSQVNGA